MKRAAASIALDATDNDRAVVAGVRNCEPSSFVRPHQSCFRRVLDVLLAIPRAIVRVFDRMRQDAEAWFDPPILCEMLPSPPPVPSTGMDALTRDQFGEHILHNLFRLSPRYANAAVLVAKLAATLSKYPEHERITVFAHFTVSRIATDPGVPIPVAWVRSRMSDVGRSEINRALEELEQDGFIQLLAVDTDNAKFVVDGISDIIRGRLTHIEVLRPL